MSGRNVTIVIHTDGDLNSRQYKVPLRLLQVGKGAAIAFAIFVVGFVAFAGPIERNAARVPGLEREVARLRAENSRVQQLAAALNRAEANYQELRQILGAKAPPAPRAAGSTTSTTTATSGMRAVILRHPSGYETMYGHASRLLVVEGDDIQSGQVIALSGSSGRSTAPHLHFEIRRDKKSLDPLTLVKEGS